MTSAYVAHRPRAATQEQEESLRESIEFMKFTKILAETSRCWPHEIDISDGELREGGGGYFPNLSLIWRAAQEHSNRLSEFHQTMVWAIFCGLHKSAVTGLKAGCTVVRKENIDLIYVEFKFSESFLSGGRYYRQIRKLYINDLRHKTNS